MFHSVCITHSIMKTLISVLSCFTLSVMSLPEPEAGLGAEDIVTLSRMKRGGACKTTADCVGGETSVSSVIMIILFR